MQKTVFYSIIAILAFSACKKTTPPAVVPDPVVNYIITDSLRVSAFTKTFAPDVYNNYNEKVYYRETAKVKSNYKVEGAAVILIFQDTSVANLGTTLTIKIPNRDLSTITGTYKAQVNDILVSWGQSVSPTAAFLSAGYFKADTGNIQIAYNARTKTLSGVITDLKYRFGLYVPYYEVGSPVIPGPNDHILLEADGSVRKHNISFQNVRSL